jgi:DNA-directed RNA polymerase specialized sigma24 family protein
MSASPPHDDARDEVSAHLEGLFAFAQIVASGPEEAVELVDESFRRARARGVRLSAADPGSVERARVALYRILLEVRAQNARESVEPGIAPFDQEMTEVKRHVARRFVDEYLPATFATLAVEPRILLMLCDVQRMSCAEAGRVLHLDADMACARLEEARAAIDRMMRARASHVERRLLETGLSGNWKREALRRMMDRELSAVPPTLQPSLLSAASGSRAEGRAPAGADPRSRRDGGITRAIKRALVVLVVIAVTGLLGYGFSTMSSRTPDLNLISLSASQAAAVEVAFETTSSEQGERFVLDRLGRRITIPSIQGSTLRGIAVRDVADGAEAPVIVYGGADGTSPVVIYVYSYAFLDANEGSLRLSSDVLSQIETEGHYDLHDLGESRALVWRRTDDIYVAVTGGDAESLRDRIRFPS